MLPANEFKEKKVQNALALLRENPGMKATVAARQAHASYHRVIRRLNGTLRSSSRGGHNKKLDSPSTEALKEYLLMCHSLGKGAGIDNVISFANSILQCNGSTTTVSRKWAKRWLTQESAWLKTIQSTPLSVKRRESHKKEDIEAHFKEFKRCREH